MISIPHVGEDPKTLKRALRALSVALLVALGVLAWAFWQLRRWREAVDNAAEEAGQEWAGACFRAHKLEVYQMDVGTAVPVYTGHRLGPFEVWSYPDDPELPAPYRYAEGKRIEAFNLEMRWLYEHPELFRATGRGTNATNRPNIEAEPAWHAP